MPYLEQIVININNAIVNKLQSSDISISVHGISKQVPRTDTNDETEIPLYVDYTGEGSFNAVDDKFALCIYHKCNSLNYQSESQLDFGDGQDFSRETAQMSVFIYGNRLKLKMTQETIISIVSASLPDTLPQSFITNITGLSSGFISAVSSPNDSLAAWRQEFVNIAYPLPPEQFFVQLNYTIETVIQKSCIEVCAEC